MREPNQITLHRPLLSSGRPHMIPGFHLTLGITITCLGMLVLLPLMAVVAKSAGAGWTDFKMAAFSPRAVAAYRVSLTTSFAAALLNSVIGTLVAWVLVRYRFPGRNLLDALVDVPLALPTAVAGITYAAIYSETGPLGSVFALGGVKVANTQLGITIVLVFVGLPFVVRTVQPVLEGLNTEVEEAAAILGAGKWTTFSRVLLPVMLPSILAGHALAFARGIGEYGSVVFMAGNMPMKTEIAPLIIMTKLDQYDYSGAAAIAIVMLVMSLLLLAAINLLQFRSTGKQP